MAKNSSGHPLLTPCLVVQPSIKRLSDRVGRLGPPACLCTPFFTLFYTFCRSPHEIESDADTYTLSKSVTITTTYVIDNYATVIELDATESM